MKQRAYQFIKYANKVYGLAQAISGVSDGRVNPQVPLKEILAMIVFSIVINVHSFNMMESLLKQGYYNKLLKKRKVKGSADTFGYGLADAGVGQLEQFNDRIIQTARYGKVFQHGTIDGFIVVALDGTEVLRTKSEHWNCEQCRQTERTKADGSKEIDYHENLVGAAYVGRPPNLVLGLERIAPGEGEVTAACRLLKGLYQRHNRYADILTFDSLYAKAPLINEVVDQNKMAVIRVKQENYHIIRDAAGLFAGQAPDLEDTLSLKSDWYEEDQVGKKYRYRVKIWDAEGFESWAGVKVPLRVLKTEETKISSKGKILDEPVVTYLVTTADKATLPTETVWRILHRRWDIENKVFHDLKVYWGFGHNYHHEGEAFMAMRWLTVIAMNLFYLFYYRRIHHYLAKGFSKKFLIWEMAVSFGCLEHPIWQPG